MTDPIYPLEASLRESPVLTADGATTVYGPFAFRIFELTDVTYWQKDEGDLRFSRRTVAVSKVNSAEVFGLFRITFPAPLPAGTEFFVRGARLQARTTSILKANTISPPALDKEMTRIGTILQEVFRDSAQAIRAEPGISAPVISEPLLPGRMLEVGADGMTVVNGTTAAVLTALEAQALFYRDQAQAAAAAAIAAALNADWDEFTGAIFERIQPLEAFAIDGAGDETGKFAALEAIVTGQLIDLRGRVHEVATVPTQNIYLHGGFLLRDAAGDNGDVAVIYPARETFDMSPLVKVTEGADAYESWPQDKLHFAGDAANPVLSCGFNGGTAHGTLSKAKQRISTDGGKTFPVEETMRQPADDGGGRPFASFAEGAYGYRQFAIVRVRDVGQSAAEQHQLLTRRLFEMRWAAPLSITTLVGSTDFTINVANPRSWNVIAGDVVNFAGVGVVNGLTISGAKTVLSITANTIVFSGGTGTATSNTAAVTGNLSFVQSAWTELLFGGQSFGSAVLAADDLGANIFSAQPILYHSMQIDAGAGAITLRSGTHGGGSGGPVIITAASLLYTTRTISAISRIAALNNGGEPTIKRLGDAGHFYGGVRGDTQPSKMWWSATSDFSTATVFEMPLYLGRDSPIPVAIDGDHGYLYAVMTDTRYRDGLTGGPVPLFLMFAKLEDFESDGLASVPLWHLLDLHFSHSNSNTGANSVGIASICYRDGRVHIAFATEHATYGVDNDGKPAVYCLSIAAGPNGPIGARQALRLA